jgi:hypothetical protein
MECITSPTLDDIQILSYVEGEADDTVVTHIKECQFCTDRANRWALLQKHLRKQLNRVTCPTSIELGDYHLGLLPAPQVLVVAQHLRECPLCRREVTDLKDFLDDLKPEISLLSTARVIVARLISGGTGSGTHSKNGFVPSSVALRGETKGPITLEAEGMVIVLDLQRTEGGSVNVVGQVAADDQERWTGALVEFRQGNELQSSAMVDDLGAFQADGLLPGPKELRILSKDNSLTVVSNFDVSI